MAYEYESRLKNRLLDLEFDTWEETAQFEREYRELERVYRKAKAFDTFTKYKKHVEKYNNSDCHELEQIFESVMKEYEENE